jgi:SAM-dependent methyltransferase
MTLTGYQLNIMIIKNTIKKSIKRLLPVYLKGLFDVLDNYRIRKNSEDTRKKKNHLKIQKFYNNGQPIQLELGAVEQRKTWLTVDLNSEADLNLDLTAPLPFPNDSVDKIYSSHVFEHFYHTDGLNLLKECYRILKKEGSFSICVPNAAIYLNAYFRPENFDTKSFVHILLLFIIIQK